VAVQATMSSIACGEFLDGSAERSGGLEAEIFE
jgi:hypothetical protein